jgi:hypothetical protein
MSRLISGSRIGRVMLCSLWLIPLLGLPLWAYEDNPLLRALSERVRTTRELQQASAKRVELTERVLKLTKRQPVDPRNPMAVFDVEVELAEARLDAVTERQERIKLLKRLVQVCGERMLVAQQASDDGQINDAPAAWAQFAWLQARLRMLRVLYEDSDEYADWRQHYFGHIARQALNAAQRCERVRQIQEDDGTLLVGYLLEAIDDVLYAQLELAENEDERRAALEARLKTLTKLYGGAKYRFEFALGATYVPFGEVKVAWLRAKIAVVLAQRDAHDGDSAELRELREVQLELLLQVLRLIPAQVEAKHRSVKHIDQLIEMVLDSPPELMTPNQRRILAWETFSVLSLIKEALPKVWDKDHADWVELELARLSVLETKVEIWNLRRSAIEPALPKVIPGD